MADNILFLGKDITWNVKAFVQWHDKIHCKMHVCSDLCHAEPIDFKPDMTSCAAALYAHADGILMFYML